MSKSDERYNAKFYEWVEGVKLHLKKGYVDSCLSLYYAPNLSTPDDIKNEKREKQDRHVTFFIDGLLFQGHHIHSLLQKMCDSIPKRKRSEHIYINFVHIYDHVDKETNTSELHAICITGAYCKSERRCFNYSYYPIKGAFPVSIENVSLLMDKIRGIIKANSYQPHYEGEMLFIDNAGKATSESKKNYKLTTCNLSFELNASSANNEASSSKRTFFEHRYKAWIQNLHILPIMAKKAVIFNTTKAIDCTDSIRRHVESGGEMKLLLEEEDFKNKHFFKRYFLNDSFQVHQDALEPNIDKRGRSGLLATIGHSKFGSSLARKISQFCMDNAAATAQDVRTTFMNIPCNLTISYDVASNVMANVISRATIDTKKKGTVKFAPKPEESQDRNPTLFERIFGCVSGNSSNNRRGSEQASPAVGTSTPAVGTSTPAVGTSTPAVGTSTPAVGTSTPAVGSGQVLASLAPSLRMPAATLTPAIYKPCGETQTAKSDACGPSSPAPSPMPAATSTPTIKLWTEACEATQKAKPAASPALQHETTLSVVTPLPTASPKKGETNRTVTKTFSRTVTQVLFTQTLTKDFLLPSQNTELDSTKPSTSAYRKKSDTEKSDATDSGLTQSPARSGCTSLLRSGSQSILHSVTHLDDLTQDIKRAGMSRSSSISAENVLDPVQQNRRKSSLGSAR